MAMEDTRMDFMEAISDTTASVTARIIPHRRILFTIQIIFQSRRIQM